MLKNFKELLKRIIQETYHELSIDTNKNKKLYTSCVSHLKQLDQLHNMRFAIRYLIWHEVYCLP